MKRNNSISLVANGKKFNSLAELARFFNINIRTIYTRYKIGWRGDDLARPTMHKGPTYHGHSHDKIYRRWHHLQDNKRDHSFDDFMTFKNWADENGYDEPSDTTHVHRKDTSAPNCPNNSFINTQSNPHAKFIEFNGESMTCSQWARKLGMSKQTLQHRLAIGLPLDIALTASVKRGNRFLKDLKFEI